MKLLNWQFQYWHFNKHFISYTSTGVMNLFALKVYCISAKKVRMKVQLFLVRVSSFQSFH